MALPTKLHLDIVTPERALTREEVDEVVCAFTPDPFQAVGLWYEEFSQTTDQEVRELLARAEEAYRAPPDEG